MTNLILERLATQLTGDGVSMEPDVVLVKLLLVFKLSLADFTLGRRVSRGIVVFQHVHIERGLAAVVPAAERANVLTTELVDHNLMVPFFLQGQESLRAQETPEFIKQWR